MTRPDIGLPELENLLRKIVVLKEVRELLDEGLADEDTASGSEKKLVKTKTDDR